MKINKEMYTTLFNTVTDSIESLERIEKELKRERQKLIHAQQKAEELYIENED